MLHKKMKLWSLFPVVGLSMISLYLLINSDTQYGWDWRVLSPRRDYADLRNTVPLLHYHCIKKKITWPIYFIMIWDTVVCTMHKSRDMDVVYEWTWIALFLSGVLHMDLDWVFGYLLRVSFRLVWAATRWARKKPSIISNKVNASTITQACP